MLSAAGRLLLGFLDYLGELCLLAGQIIESLLYGKKRWNLLAEQIVEIGFRSQPVVIVTGAFVGAVLSAQGLFQLSGLKMESMGGALVSVGCLLYTSPSPRDS